MRSPRYLRTIFNEHQRVKVGFVNIYLNADRDHFPGSLWDSQHDADKCRRGSRICIYRLNIRARVQEARA